MLQTLKKKEGNKTFQNAHEEGNKNAPNAHKEGNKSSKRS
jgi:hypothetical protein